MLNKLLTKKDRASEHDLGERPNGSPPEGSRIYVIGDIHGCDELLAEMHQLVHEDAYRVQAPRTVVTYLGDYVDRGPESRGVIDLLLEHPLPEFDRFHIMGNHEAAMLDFLRGDASGLEWLGFGGKATLESYGISPPPEWPPQAQELERAREDLLAALPKSHFQFLETLRPSHVEGDYLMVHAGVRPGVAIDAQSHRDFMWIREPFLKSRAPFGKIIVHGHTISEMPEIRSNRIGIDTGAFRTGRLTCLILDGNEISFIQT